MNAATPNAATPNPATLAAILDRGVERIISRPELEALLRSGRQLRLKMGFDPSRPDIHLGHVVGLRKLRQLQELGHQVILIVGDWTAQIGDPSGRSATRPVLSHAEVLENAQSYLRQFFKVVDESRALVLHQSEWFGKFTLADVIGLTGRFTVAQFLQRADYAKRLEEQQPIALTELLYPLLQAYDSVVIEADVEFGGTDQMFNLGIGRELQRAVGQTPQQCLMMPILPGTDGVQKMSKSLDNYIGVEEPPAEMYGKVMSIPDALLPAYFEYLTDLPAEGLAELAGDLEQHAVNPMTWKKRLARDITGQFHGAAAADGAQSEFERVVQRGRLPDEMPEAALDELRRQGAVDAAGARVSRLLVAAGLAESNSQAKRLLSQGAVELLRPDGGSQPLTGGEEAVPVAPGDVVRAGRRRYVRLV